MIPKSPIGIWRFQKLLPFVPPKFQLSLGEGRTELKNIDGINFKFEFSNPTGSVKDRGLAYQISKLKQTGVKQAAISSSGNAGISAASYANLAGIKLTVFVSRHINATKLHILKKLNVIIKISSRPVSDCIKYSKANNIFNLRPSADPNGYTGYSTIAYELNEILKKIDAIFFPVSSGTTLVGVASGFEKLGYLPQIFAVQTESVHPIAILFDKDFRQTKRSIADSIVAKYTPRIQEVVELIKKSQGTGLVVSDADIKKANNWLEDNRIKTSYEGALALAGLWKARKKGRKFKNAVCLLTGKRYV